MAHGPDRGLLPSMPPCAAHTKSFLLVFLDKSSRGDAERVAKHTGVVERRLEPLAILLLMELQLLVQRVGSHMIFYRDVCGCLVFIIHKAGTRELKPFGVLFGNPNFLVRNYQLLLPWKHMKPMVRPEHSEKKNKM